MFCPYCGKQKADGVAVCPYCGNVDYEESEMATRIIPENMQLDVQPQGMYNQNMMGQGYQQNMMGQGYQQNVMEQPGETKWENPEPPKKKKKTGLIVGIIIAAVLLIGGGITAFLLLRSGASSPEEATQEAINAFNDKDAEAFTDTLSDGMYEKLADLFNELLADDKYEEMGIDLDFSDGKALKESVNKILKTSFKLKDGSSASVDMNYEIVGISDKDLEDLNNYESEIMDLFESYDDVEIVEIEVSLKFGEESSTETQYDICYKEDGRWYSSLAATIFAPAFLKYSAKSSKVKDVEAAESIVAATNSALSNEDVYDEVYTAMPESQDPPVVLATAARDEKFKKYNNDVSNDEVEFLRQLNDNLGGCAPSISYTYNGASYWSVGLSNKGTPVVWLGTSEGDTRWELLPEIDKEYK